MKNGTTVSQLHTLRSAHQCLFAFVWFNRFAYYCLNNWLLQTHEALACTMGPCLWRATLARNASKSIMSQETGKKNPKQTNQTFLSILPKYFILYVFICRTGTHRKNTKISLKITIQTSLTTSSEGWIRKTVIKLWSGSIGPNTGSKAFANHLQYHRSII